MNNLFILYLTNVANLEILFSKTSANNTAEAGFWWRTLENQVLFPIYLSNQSMYHLIIM